MTDSERIRGVQIAQPSQIHASIKRQVDSMLSTLPDDAKAALLGVATEAGFNLVFTVKVGKNWDAGVWVGKSGWDSPLENGVGIRKVWK